MWGRLTMRLNADRHSLWKRYCRTSVQANREVEVGNRAKFVRLLRRLSTITKLTGSVNKLASDGLAVHFLRNKG